MPSPSVAPNRTAFMTLTALLGLTLAVLPLDIEGDLKAAQRHLDHGKWDKAEVILQQITVEAPGAAEAWYGLAFCRHQQKQYEAACAAGARAAAFPEFEAASLYNMACGYSLLGQTEQAEKSLRSALDAGYFDYDNMAVDTDIASLREAGVVSFAPQRRYTDFKFRNGVSCAYEVILPNGHDAAQPCEAIVCFPPGQGQKRSADWFTAEVLGEEAREAGQIIVVLSAPDRGWQSHPAHHALEGLLKQVRKEHKIDGKFHVVGFAEGARSAGTYSRMSAKYFQSLTTISSRAWAGWDDPGKSFRGGMPVHLIVGEQDVVALDQAKKVDGLIRAKKGNSRVTVVPKADRRLLSLRGAALIKEIVASSAAR